MAECDRCSLCVRRRASGFPFSELTLPVPLGFLGSGNVNYHVEVKPVCTEHMIPSPQSAPLQVL